MTEPPSRYLIPAGVHRVEEVIQKSRFITTGAHAAGKEAALTFLKSIREEFPDATHHCWAFAVGPPGDTLSVGMSDDGEPHGTAGRPMLTALLHGEVGEIVAVCTRYYGGTKLGTGGLSRAYSGGVKLLLSSPPTQDKVERVLLEFEVEYGTVDSVQRLLEEVEALVHGVEYGEKVRYELAVPREGEDSLTEALAGLTGGRAVVRRMESPEPQLPDS